ncbi:MAG TPA: hypothetical protein IGS37_10670 [Synechococcales cyanobacterium M55_K2018_004]|nr:hypothetical protein [Synechococcales cyanobacterium M55_K2018_004]
MLYLAEVQRRKGVIGPGKAEFRLLACQRSESSWSAVPGEEVVPAPDDVPYNAGALVMVELSAGRQIQRHNEAGRQLVSILQNFSRLQEKFKTQEEEIEQWKESLIFQSQELNSRQAEMDAREEQLRQMEEDFERLAAQKQEIDESRAELNRLKEEFERKSSELEGAWAHLRGEMNRFEEQKAEQQGSVLDEGKAHQLQELLNRLSGAIAPTEAIREQLNLSFEILNRQQASLDQSYQTLEQLRSTAQQMQDGVGHQTGELQARWQEWKQAQAELEQLTAELRSHQSALAVQQEHAELLNHQIQQQQEVYRQACYLADASGLPVSVDMGALEQKSIEELQKIVADMEHELSSVSRFVEGQEEELTLQQQEIDELKKKLEQASEYDRLQMEAELADEQDRYRMLNETLIGQRRSLHERQAVLKAHQTILARRQGTAVAEPQAPVIDLSPLLNRLDAARQHLAQALQKTQEQIQSLQSQIAPLKATVEQRSGEQEARWHDLQQQQQQLQNQKAATGEQWGKVNVYQETLALMQNDLGGLKDKLEAIAGVMGQFQEASDYQLQAIAEMRQTILSLTQDRSKVA